MSLCGRNTERDPSRPLYYNRRNCSQAATNFFTTDFTDQSVMHYRVICGIRGNFFWLFCLWPTPKMFTNSVSV